MGWTVGLPSMKLNNIGQKSKHCGNFVHVAMEALEERNSRNPDFDPNRSYLNIYEGFRTAAELIAYSQQHIKDLTEQQHNAGKRKIRTDAVVMCATIVKPHVEMMDLLSYDDQVQFLRDSAEKIRAIVGEKNVKSEAYHFDEQGPHLHIFWEPMTSDGRLCAKDKHNIKFFGRLNREMPPFLRSKGWDIDDCQVYDAAVEELMDSKERQEQRRRNGRSSAVYKRDCEREAKKEAAELRKELDALRDEYSSLETNYLELANTCNVLAAELSKLPIVEHESLPHGM